MPWPAGKDGGGGGGGCHTTLCTYTLTHQASPRTSHRDKQCGRRNDQQLQRKWMHGDELNQFASQALRATSGRPPGTCGQLDSRVGRGLVPPTDLGLMTFVGKSRV